MREKVLRQKTNLEHFFSFFFCKFGPKLQIRKQFFTVNCMGTNAIKKSSVFRPAINLLKPKIQCQKKHVTCLSAQRIFRDIFPKSLRNAGLRQRYKPSVSNVNHISSKRYEKLAANVFLTFCIVWEPRGPRYAEALAHLLI